MSGGGDEGVELSVAWDTATGGHGVFMQRRVNNRQLPSKILQAR